LGDDVEERGVDAQGDALPGEVDPGADLLTADAGAATGAGQALDFHHRVGGQRAGWQGGGG
jgi:hypothetical protein